MTENDGAPLIRASLTYVGHATVVIDLDGVRLLTDPVLRPRVAHLWRAVPVPGEAARAIDAVLISHAHWDHLDLPSLARLGRALPIVCPRGLGKLLRRRRFGDVTELEAGEQARIGPVTVTAVFAEHESGRGPFGARSPALGYVAGGSQTIYFAGDTGLFQSMTELAPLDAALLPVAGWGAKLGPGHLDARTAAEALLLLRPRIAVPIHWGTLAPFGRHRPGNPAADFARHAAELAPEVRVRVLQPGETVGLS
jgi:L-ascorbate metabolism protein UlaG (beta-lactamase superfamily)